MSDRPMRPEGHERTSPRRGIVERLYVYWLVSTLLLALTALVVIVVTRGAVQRQAGRIDELAGRMAALEQSPQEARHRPAPVHEPPAPRVPPGQSPATRPAPGPTSRTQTRPAATSVPVLRTEAELRAALDAVMASSDARSPADVRDREEAHALVQSAIANIERARWSGATWARLAALARLLGRDANAETLARQATAAGEPLLGYLEVSIRALLARGRATEALPLVHLLDERTGGAAVPRVLLATTLLAVGQQGEADEALSSMTNMRSLSPRDLLLLGRELLELEHWEQLAEVLGTLTDVPAELSLEYNFLQATLLAQSERTAEAYAALEYVAAHLPAQGAETAPPYEGAWPAPQPSRYEVETWRGVSLMHANQTDAAREVLLQAAQLNPGRPAAHYYLGLLEDRADKRDRAVAYLRNAVACAARLAPAWEALAALDLQAGELDAALGHLATALDINPRRASAQFLAAIAHARLADRDAAAAALRSALRLDPRYLAEAEQAEVLARLFTPAEMEQLATATDAASEPTTLPATTEPGAP